jgi:hypothetical protein
MSIGERGTLALCQDIGFQSPPPSVIRIERLPVTGFSITIDHVS